jgi:hypothetical protein
LVIVGGPITVSDAVLLVVVVGPLSFELIGPVVLFCTPGAMPVTLTENMQEPFAASVSPERLMTFVPAVAVIDPVQVVLKPLGVDTTSPTGSVSLNEIPVSGVPFEFMRVKLRLVFPFTGIVDAPNAFLIVGGGS